MTEVRGDARAARRRESTDPRASDRAVSPTALEGGAVDEGEHYRTRALLRGLDLLACFRPETPELSLRDCIDRTGLDKATAFRLLSCLVDAGFLARDPERAIYRVGPAILPIASAFHEGNAIATIADPYVRALAAETGQTATLAVLDGATTVNILVAQSDRPLRRLSYVGERFPLHATSVGKAMAAFLPPSQVEILLGAGELARVTEKTIATPADFSAELERVRRDGHALDDEEAIPGVRCVGWVIRDYTGRPVAGTSVAGAAGEFVGEALQRYADAVSRAANAVSTQLGFVPRT